MKVIQFQKDYNADKHINDIETWIEDINGIIPKKNIKIKASHYLEAMKITKKEYERKYLSKFKDDYKKEIRIRTEDEVFDLLNEILIEISIMLEKKDVSELKNLLNSYVK